MTGAEVRDTDTEQAFLALEAAGHAGWDISIAAASSEVGFAQRPAGQEPRVQITATRPGCQPIVEAGESVAAVTPALLKRLRAA